MGERVEAPRRSFEECLRTDIILQLAFRKVWIIHYCFRVRGSERWRSYVYAELRLDYSCTIVSLFNSKKRLKTQFLFSIAIVQIPSRNCDWCICIYTSLLWIKSAKIRAKSLIFSPLCERGPSEGDDDPKLIPGFLPIGCSYLLGKYLDVRWLTFRAFPVCGLMTMTSHFGSKVGCIAAW